MQDSIEEVAYTVGGAIISPSLGAAELILALLVACGFAYSAFYGLVHRRHDNEHWRQNRF